jgi:hypothetical protein
MRLRRAVVRCAWLLLPLPARPLSAQVFTRPELHWETIHTAHFDVHFPRAMRPWATDAAGRLEAVRGAVVALVGSGPSRKVTVVIDDPYNVSNGASLPILDKPTIILWPTPPEPSDEIGHVRDWAELLTVHEFAHIAHLTRPSRNPLQRAVWRLLPLDISPIARNSPRWVIEGYATYVEGRITGSGRPNSVARAGVLRQFALEGRLPTYAQLNGSPQYLGGAMAYLVGSAFLEWLVARSGEESLPRLWQRMTARDDRDFGTAFFGVFGDTPQALYGRFTADLTGKALRAADDIAAAGLDSGETFQHLTWYTGDPAVSRDGASIAVPVRVPGRPSRIVVWSTAPARPDSADLAAQARMLARDPDDVPTVRPYPAARRPVAILEAARGVGFDLPRFFADGDRLLVTHDEPLRDGVFRPDLYEWNLRTDEVRRITHGAAVRGADPAPDGHAAIGVRCLGGVCDLVRIDLRRGSVTVLLAGSPTREYYRPRYAPDGRTGVVTVHDGDHWHLEAFAVDTGGATDVHAVGPLDGASRYAASYVQGGASVVTVSELGGVQHLEIVELATGAMHPLAATTGGAVAPDASLADSHVYFLSLSARGRDLHRVDAADVRSSAIPTLSPTLAPAAVPLTPRTDSLVPIVVASPTAYGVGPREYRYLPGGSFAPDGHYVTLWVGSSDPVGRLAWNAQGSLGDAGAWRGAAAGIAWRGLPVLVTLSAFAVSQFPSRQSAGRFARDSLDATDRGGLLSADYIDFGTQITSQARLGVSTARLAVDDGPGRARTLGFAAYSGAADFSRGDLTLLGSVGGLGTVGTTDGTAWRRLLLRVAITAGVGGSLVRYGVTYGTVNRDAPAFEQMVAGGTPSPLTDSTLLSQRIAVSALPLGVVGGHQLLDQRLEGDAGVVALYYDRLSTITSGDANHDVYGAEVRGDFPRVPFLALPSAWVTAGMGYSISAPFKYKLRGYVGVRYTP